MFTVFIDGDQGTTGLRVRERLAGREDITLLSLPEEKRKDLDARAAMGRPKRLMKPAASFWS